MCYDQKDLMSQDDVCADRVVMSVKHNSFSRPMRSLGAGRISKSSTLTHDAGLASLVMYSLYFTTKTSKFVSEIPTLNTILM